MTRGIALLTASLVAGAAWSAQAAVRDARHSPASLESTDGEVAVSFRLDARSNVVLRIFDGRDLEVRRVSSGKDLTPGDHELIWDGHDGRGRPVPPGAYRYTLESTGVGGKVRVWDPTEARELRTAVVAHAEWDRGAGVVRYSLPAPSRVRVRIGLPRDGPLLRTLVDWPARVAGSHEEAWDGMDASGVIDLSDHENLRLLVEAFPLPRNTVLVGPPQARAQLIADLPADTARRNSAAPPRRMYDYPNQPIEERRDYVLRLIPPDGATKDESGLTIVHGPTPVRVEVASSDLMRVLDERAEAVFYVDGQFVFETEVGFLPMTWVWRPRGARPGRHYITANLRGYEGHFGTATLGVLYQPTEPDTP